MFGSALYPVDEDNLTWVMHLVSPWALGDLVTQSRHHHVGAAALDQLGGVVLPGSVAIVVFDPDKRQRPLSEAPGSFGHRVRVGLCLRVGNWWLRSG